MLKTDCHPRLMMRAWGVSLHLSTYQKIFNVNLGERLLTHTMKNQHKVWLSILLRPAYVTSQEQPPKSLPLFLLWTPEGQLCRLRSLSLC